MIGARCSSLILFQTSSAPAALQVEASEPAGRSPIRAARATAKMLAQLAFLAFVVLEPVYAGREPRVSDALLRSPAQKAQLEVLYKKAVEKRLGRVLEQKGFSKGDVNLGYGAFVCTSTPDHHCSAVLLLRSGSWQFPHHTTWQFGMSAPHSTHKSQCAGACAVQLVRHLGPNIRVPGDGARRHRGRRWQVALWHAQPAATVLHS